MTQTAVQVRPITPALGAVISDVDVAMPLSPEAAGRIRRAALAHRVVFVRGQDLSRSQMLAFMANFGTPCMEPFAAIDQPIPPEQTIIDMPTLPNRRATAVWHIDCRSPPSRRALSPCAPWSSPPPEATPAGPACMRRTTRYLYPSRGCSTG
jgi:alpha-ketoglutarate-dependent taurine dioxygenase